MKQPGYSYVEILVAVALLAVALPPALDALGTQVRGAGQGVESMRLEYKVQSKAEELLSEPWSALDMAVDIAGSKSVPSLYSDPAGSPDRILVYLAHYDFENTDADGNPFTNPNPNLVWIGIQAENGSQKLYTVRTWE